MHELSIAQAVVRIAGEHAAGRRVSAVCVKVGHLRQVVPSALEFAFELLVDGTELEGAELQIESVPAAGVCRDCGAATRLPAFPVRCARCGAPNVEITEGEELLVDSLVLDDPEDVLTTTGGARDGD